MVTQLGYLTEGEFVQPSIKDAWISRRVVEGRYDSMQGEVLQPMDVFDLWLNDPAHDVATTPSGFVSARSGQCLSLQCSTVKHPCPEQDATRSSAQ